MASDADIQDWLDQVEIDGKLCEAVETLTHKVMDDALEEVVTLTPSKTALGYKSGVDKFEISLEHRVTKPREVDYHELKRSKREIGMAWQEGSGLGEGTKFTAQRCRVKEVETAYNTDGEVVDKVTLISLDVSPEPFDT